MIYKIIFICNTSNNLLPCTKHYSHGYDGKLMSRLVKEKRKEKKRRPFILKLPFKKVFTSEAPPDISLLYLVSGLSASLNALYGQRFYF